MKTCIVIANGPSLNDVPNEFLRKHISFGTNAIYLREGFSPSCYVAFDKGFIKREKEKIQAFCPKVIQAFIRQDEGVTGPNVVPIFRADREMPTSKKAMGIVAGGSVTFIAMQLAGMAGFEQILVVGLDHNFFEADTIIPHFAENYPTEPIPRTAEYCEGVKIRIEYCYQVIRKEMDRIGGHIINLTPGSRCNIFEKRDIKDYA